VAKQCVPTCVRTALKGKTRIMVTNQLHSLPVRHMVGTPLSSPAHSAFQRRTPLRALGMPRP